MIERKTPEERNQNLKKKIEETLKKGEFIEVSFKFIDGETIDAIISEKQSFQVDDHMGSCRLLEYLRMKYHQ